MGCRGLGGAGDMVLGLGVEMWQLRLRQWAAVSAGRGQDLELAAPLLSAACLSSLRSANQSAV